MPKSSHQVEKLSKLLAYVLGRRPDEFGLVPDAEGYVAIKELLQSLHEEQGLRHVRAVHLNEVVTTLLRPSVEISGSRIRAHDRAELPLPREPEILPKLLYIAIRRRAYPVALQKGLTAASRPHLILSDDMGMALRLGRRLDNDPTLLTVQVTLSMEKGTHYRQYGQHLFYADRIPNGTFSGPSLPKERTEKSPTTAPPKPSQPKTPGSYFPEPDVFSPPATAKHSRGRRKEPEWKKARRQARKHKEQHNR